jgi:hypothetical protein
MRVLGFCSVAVLLLSFVLWLAQWIYFQFLITSDAYGSPMAKVMRGVGVVEVLTEYLAILLIAIGLIVGGTALKRLSTNSQT